MRNIKLLHDFEAAKFLRIGANKLVRLAKQGKAPCVLLPDGEVRFIESDILEWVENHKTAAISEPSEGGAN